MVQSETSSNDILKYLVRPTWVEVDLDAIAFNVRSIKKYFNNMKLIGVLKGDACGFGTEECGLAMESAGADMLAVGNPFEVKVLRDSGIKCSILLFGSYLPQAALDIVLYGATPTVFDESSAIAFAEAAKKIQKGPVNVFVKIDTGIGRLGVPFEQGSTLVKFVNENRYLRLKGLYSHISTSSSDEGYEEQARRLEGVLNELYSLGIEVPIRMISSTSGILRQHTSYKWANAIDPGRLLFGINDPPSALGPGIELKPALLSLKTKLIQIKNVTKGDPPQYSESYSSGTIPKYGVIPLGWTDIYLPSEYKKSGALIRGVKARIHKFTAEHGVIDLTEVQNAEVGDTVTLIGKDGGSFIEVTEFAKQMGLVVSDITRRFHRHISFIYFRNGKPIKVKTLVGNYNI